MHQCDGMIFYDRTQEIGGLKEILKQVFCLSNAKKLLKIIAVCDKMRIFAGNLSTKRQLWPPVVLCG